MKRTLRNVASALLVGASAVALVILIGCGRHDTGSPSSNEVSEVVYPLGVDLSTLEGNMWTYNSTTPQGKAYSIQVKSIQNQLASFQNADTKEEYIGLHTFGHAQLGYDSNGALIGRTGSDEQVILPNNETSHTFVMNGGLFDGESVSISYSQGVYTVMISGMRVELQRGIGITKVVSGQGSAAAEYDLENTVPDPLVHFGE